MERYREIEKSITGKYHNIIYSKFIKALKEYELVKENDKVLVCISGGKDSMLMAKLFQELLKFSDFPFKCEFVVMNPGYNERNLAKIRENLEILNIPADIVETDIFKVATNQDTNACYMCARMRRGALYTIAKDKGCNKIALGHHYDDVIETTLMGMLNSGVFQTMLPKIKSQNFDNMELIRPLYFIREKDIKEWALDNGLEFLQCACRFTEENYRNMQEKSKSMRLETKKLIHDLLEYNEYAEKNIFKAAENVNVDMVLGYKKNGVKHSFLDEYDNEKEDD